MNEQEEFNAKMREEYSAYCKSIEGRPVVLVEILEHCFNYAYRAGAQNMMLGNNKPGDFHVP